MDESTAFAIDVRMCAMEMAIEARDDGEADASTIERARAFYDFLMEVATPAPAPKTGGGPVVPFKGKNH